MSHAHTLFSVQCTVQRELQQKKSEEASQEESRRQTVSGRERERTTRTHTQTHTSTHWSDPLSLSLALLRDSLVAGEMGREREQAPLTRVLEGEAKKGDSRCVCLCLFALPVSSLLRSSLARRRVAPSHISSSSRDLFLSSSLVVCCKKERQELASCLCIKIAF